MAEDYYIGAMERFLKVSRRLYCRYCGAESLAIGHFGICRVCEAPLSQRKAEVSASDHSIVESGDAIWGAISKGDMAAALTTVDARIGAHEEPGFLIAGGLFYIRASNEELKKIRYDLDGFMEENAVHRENSEKMMLNAKTLLNKAVKLSEKHIGNEGGMAMSYLPFLAELKLGHLKGAMHYMKGIKADENIYLKDYAQMLLHAHMKKGEPLMEHCDRMIRDGKVGLNLFYYIGYALFLKKAYSDSKAVLARLSRIGGIEAADMLIEDMEKA